MKKYIILAIATLLNLTACAQNNKKVNENKTLVAWFSWSGNTLKDIVKATPDAEHLEGLAVITTKMNGEDIDKKFPQVDAWLKKLNL